MAIEYISDKEPGYSVRAKLNALIDGVNSGGGGGTSDHALLTNRDAASQHPQSAITGLSGDLQAITDAIVSANANIAQNAQSILDHEAVTGAHIADGDIHNQVPTGGLTAQVLTKLSDTDWDLVWKTPDWELLEHNELIGIDQPDCHGILSITGLRSALDARTRTFFQLTEPSQGESDPGDIWVKE